VASRYLLTTGLAATLLVTTASARVHETFREPTVWHSEGGVLQRTLEMRRAKTTLGSRKILTLTYEGTIPGPTWRLAPGDRIKVRLVNNMTPPAASESGTATASPESLFTNIHVHGLQVDPRGNGDDIFVEVPPGQYFDYDIPLPANQPSGLFFYHPHRHRSATGQFWNGLGGAIIVEGGLDDVPAVKAARDA